MPKEIQASPAEYQSRVDVCKALIIKTLPMREIVNYCVKNHPEWGVTKQTIRLYVHAAQEQLRSEAVNIDFTIELQLAKARNELAMQLALKVQDVKTFAAINKQNADLLNLRNLRYEPEWRETARAAGFDPDALAQAFFGSERDLVVLDEYEAEPYEETNDQTADA